MGQHSGLVGTVLCAMIYVCGDTWASKDAKWASILVVRYLHSRKPVEMQTVTSTSSTNDWGTSRVLSGLDSTLLSGEDRSLYNVACGDMGASKDANWGASILVVR